MKAVFLFFNLILFWLFMYTFLFITLTDCSFGNLSNLQFLGENGRVQKFANSFCSLAFMLQEYRLSGKEGFQMLVSDPRSLNNSEFHESESSAQPSANICIRHWNDYAVKLSGVLASFLLAPEDIKTQVSAGRSIIPVSSLYGELSIKWFMRALLTVFPCIRACSNQNELPSHLGYVILPWDFVHLLVMKVDNSAMIY